jgi:tetratricopeptide (TPR) repeat protein
MLRRSLALRERSGLSNNTPLGNLGWLLTRQGKWKQAEECFQQAIEVSDKRSQAIYRGNIGRLYELQENYSQAELELLYRLEVLERDQELQNLFGYTGIMLNYALSGNVEQSKRYLEIARTLFEWETRPRRKWWCLYEIAEGSRILRELDAAQTACQQSIEWFQNNTEHAEEIVYLAEARLVMAKILIDKGECKEALAYLKQANIAFNQCEHYARGETLFSLGKAHQGLGNTSQAQEYMTTALNEFQRLELHHKAQETQEALDKLGG